ncbi:MAG: peroxiredoxin family protein [Gemmataceae bacterium]
MGKPLFFATSSMLLMMIAPAMAMAQTPAKPEMRMVSYEELGQIVRGHRGKVVVVYFWGNHCVPCKSKGIPRMIEMHRRYASEGFEVVSVALQNSQDQAARESLSRFLNEKAMAPFETVLLDPDACDYCRNLRFPGVPGVFIFNQSNSYVRKMPEVNERGEETEEVDYDQIEMTVKQLLRK